MHGLVVWKVAALLALGVGGVWGAAQVLHPQDNAEPVAAAPANVVADRPAAVTGAQADGATSDASKADPFAGVDINDNSVLRHIAGIEEKSRTRPAQRRATPGDASRAAPADAARAAQVRAAPAIENRPAPQSINRPAAQPVSQPAAQPIQAPVAAAPAPAASVPVATAAAPEPTRSPAPAIAAPLSDPLPARAPVDAPVRAAPASTPTVLAAVRPEPAPATPVVAPPLRVINRTVPSFPAEAIRADVRAGRVVARLTIDASGQVTATQILSATPSGYFERESRRALSTWRYEPPGQAASADVELVFSRE